MSKDLNYCTDWVHRATGKVVLCRALLHSDSQSHFITSSLAKRQGLRQEERHVIVDGITKISSTIRRKSTHVKIASRINNKRYGISALITTNFTVNLPTTPINTTNWLHNSLNSLSRSILFHKSVRINL